MLKLSDASKLASAPDYAHTRECACGLTVFIGTLVVLGLIAVLAAGLGLHSLV